MQRKEHQHHREASRVAVHCRWRLMVEDAFIELESLVARGMKGTWSSNGRGAALHYQARMV